MVIAERGLGSLVAIDRINKTKIFIEESSCLHISLAPGADLLQQISEHLWLFSKRDRQEVNH